jgi:hypothetical protein
LNFSRQVPVIESIGVTNALVWLKKFSTESVAAARAEIGERHLVSASDLGIEMMNLARESIWWKSLGHCPGINQCPVNSLWRCAEHSVKSDNVLCCSLS